MNPTEPRGDEGRVVVFHVHQRKDMNRKKTKGRHMNYGEREIQ
jgi:hypothetical protein